MEGREKQEKTFILISGCRSLNVLRHRAVTKQSKLCHAEINLTAVYGSLKRGGRGQGNLLRQKIL